MFTGIVQTQGQIRTLTPNEFGAKLTVDRGQMTPETTPVAHGDSICVSGVCLTAIDITDDTLSFDVIAETLAKTKLGDLAEGDTVNLEPAVTPHQPLGGHFMQGHVDGVGEIVAVLDTPEEWRTTVRPPAELMRYIVPKGSVAIDGVSLTLASVTADTFDVALIPETLERTTLGTQREGTRVNLEADILAKTVVHTVERMQVGSDKPHDVGVTMETLRDAGFAG
ncbi:MAG: riboflavin synthase [Planctomycetota bacterium]